MHDPLENRGTAPLAASAETYRSGDYHRTVFQDDPQVARVLAGERARKLRRFVGEEDRVLEYGVGPGLNLRELSCRVRVGYDVAPHLRSACEAHGIRYVTDLQELADERFTLVLAHHVLEHVPHPLQTLRDLAQLLVPRGRLLLYVPFELNRRYRRWWPGDPNRHLYAWNALTLGNLAMEAGLNVRSTAVRAYGYEQRLAPLARLGRPLYRAAVRAANALRPCLEIELLADRGEEGASGRV